MQSIKSAFLYFLISFIGLVPTSVQAGPYADDMAKCLVASTSENDKNNLVKWIFAAATLHPAVSSISSVSNTQRNELNIQTAKLFEKLLTESCKTQVQQALKYEGPSTIESAFQVLGQVAARGMFTDPAVSRFVAEMGNHVDKKKMDSILGAAKKSK